MAVLIARQQLSIPHNISVENFKLLFINTIIQIAVYFNPSFPACYLSQMLNWQNNGLLIPNEKSKPVILSVLMRSMNVRAVWHMWKMSRRSWISRVVETCNEIEIGAGKICIVKLYWEGMCVIPAELQLPLKTQKRG